MGLLIAIKNLKYKVNAFIGHNEKNEDSKNAFIRGARTIGLATALSKEEHPIVRLIGVGSVIVPIDYLPLTFFPCAMGWLVANKKVKALGRRYISIVGAQVPTVVHKMRHE